MLRKANLWGRHSRESVADEYGGVYHSPKYHHSRYGGKHPKFRKVKRRK